MTLTRRWTTGAASNLTDGISWYDEQQLGLGSDLAAEVNAAANHALQRPDLFRSYEHPGLPSEQVFRKIQLQRISEYGVIFTVLDDTFWILAVAHAKRRPGYWANRASKL